MIFIDLYLIIAYLMPSSHQTIETVYSMKAAMKPLNTIQTAFYSFFDDVEYRLRFNGQVIYMEQFLNENFDPANNGITITDATNFTQVFLFNEAELNEPTYVHNLAEAEPPLYLYNSSEINQYDFFVNVPSSLVFNETQMRKDIDTYKHAGKRYKIILI